jgi:hypothetical protein
MSNMSYCRFRNTLNDLRDCANNFDEDDLSDDEHNARRSMILEIVELLHDIGAEVDEENIDPVFLEKR